LKNSSFKMSVFPVFSTMTCIAFVLKRNDKFVMREKGIKMIDESQFYLSVSSTLF
jgi:hypothetical protein